MNSKDESEFAAVTALSLLERDQPPVKQQLNSIFHPSSKSSPERSKEEILLSLGAGTVRSERDNDVVQPLKTSKLVSTGPPSSHCIRQPAPAGWSMAAQQSSSAQTDAQPTRGFVNSDLQSPGKAINFLQNKLDQVLSQPLPRMAQVRKSPMTYLLVTCLLVATYHSHHFTVSGNRVHIMC